MLSVYRVFSLALIKPLTVLFTGLESETPLTVHALERSLPLGGPVTHDRQRSQGSTSTLQTYHDGFLILLTNAALIGLACLSAVCGLIQDAVQRAP